MNLKVYYFQMPSFVILDNCSSCSFVANTHVLLCLFLSLFNNDFSLL
jgi:hypothetical protein